MEDVDGWKAIGTGKEGCAPCLYSFLSATEENSGDPGLKVDGSKEIRQVSWMIRSKKQGCEDCWKGRARLRQTFCFHLLLDFERAVGHFDEAPRLKCIPCTWIWYKVWGSLGRMNSLVTPGWVGWEKKYSTIHGWWKLQLTNIERVSWIRCSFIYCITWWRMLKGFKSRRCWMGHCLRGLRAHQTSTLN